MANTAMTLYKLMILYMLNLTKYPLTNARISDFMLQKGYATYFNLQTALSELMETGLIKSENTMNSSFFKSTDEGKHTLDLLSNDINQSIKNEIKSYLNDNSKTIKSDISATANFEAVGNGDFVVNLNINEYQSKLLSLSFLVPAENIAEKICSEWSKKSDDVYALLFNSLVLDKYPQ